MKTILAWGAGFVLAGVAAAQGAGEARPLAAQGYLGLAVRDIASGDTVVSWIYPGPLHGTGISAPELSRPDLLVAVDGKALTEETLGPYIRGLAPGTTVTLEYRRSNRRGSAIPVGLDHEEEVRTLEVVLASREEWTGTIHRGRGHEGRIVLDGERLLDPADRESVLGRAIQERKLGKPLATLTGVFADYLAKNDDFHSLSRVRAPFEDPFCLPELERRITNPTHEVPGDPVESALALVGGNLDLPPPSEVEDSGMRHVSDEDGAEYAIAIDFEPPYANAALFAGAADRAFAADCLSLLRVPRRTFYLAGEDTKVHVGVIRRSMDEDWGRLARSFHRLCRDMESLGDALAGSEEHDALPPERVAIAEAVEGDVLWCQELTGLGWYVVGGRGRNRYDMAKIAIVIDRGGDDEYYASALRVGTHAIVDLAGDDLYTGTSEQGPGSALLGLSFIDDRAGDDRYEGELLSCGAAMFGMSLLLDRGGHDLYQGTEWSMGAACYGAGLLFDLGNGNDRYLGDFLCEGVGGPRGFGCIVDEGGRDLYRANGPTPSAYGTAAVYQSFSQGIGFGYRQYAAGGIGMISDLGGDDRYEAGEFAQGGAYYWGLGILHDGAGNDLYYGNRYGQGFGVHQAAGMLVDDGGDDTYWSMTAASQGAAWDVGVGMLLDRAGNDSYQCDGLGQGGASMQGIAYLVDLAGRDRYVARGGGVQGGVGGNSYHWHETGAFSFALLLDLGGAPDHYSSGRADDEVSRQGAFDEGNPEHSTLYGLAIDR